MVGIKVDPLGAVLSVGTNGLRNLPADLKAVAVVVRHPGRVQAEAGVKEYLMVVDAPGRRGKWRCPGARAAAQRDFVECRQRRRALIRRFARRELIGGGVGAAVVDGDRDAVGPGCRSGVGRRRGDVGAVGVTLLSVQPNAVPVGPQSMVGVASR